MAGRKRSIRFKIFAILLVPVTALVVIWGFAATVTIEQGQQLLRIQKVYDNVVYPVSETINALQTERFVSVSYLAWRTASLRTDLQGQRRRTDGWADEMTRLSEQARDETPPAMWSRVQDLIRQVRGLDVLRGQIDDHTLTRLEAIEEYSSVVETANQVYDRLMISPDIDIVGQTKALILLVRSREVVSQQSALVLGAQASGRMSQDERDAFSGMVGKRRLLYQLGTSQLDSTLLKQFGALNASPVYSAFLSLENDVIARVRPGQPLPPDAIAWPTTAQALTSQLTETTNVAADVTAARALPLAQAVLWRIGIVGVLGLAAVLATMFISFRFARTLTGELTALHRAARDLAERRLPDLVRRLRRGDDVDVAAETPPVVQRSDTFEVENVGNAFTSVQQTAVEAAVGQAELRKGVNKVFLNLARRSQSLLQRQLGMLDSLEKVTADPDLLERLFGVDHLTTRMRRHAEGLIILSGAVPGRGWRNPVRLYDVVRAAIEEVEDYLRVDVTVPHGYSLVGGSVTDMIHLLAELIENATVFSPPHTRVHVRGEVVGRGFALEVEDRGLGIPPEELERLNQRLADPPEFDLADSDRLGLFVVGLLARRHNIRVSLRSSPYGGTSAVMLLPQEIVVEAGMHEPAVQPLSQPEHVAPALALTPLAGGGHDSLPKRVRQANIAPQLREEPPLRQDPEFREQPQLREERSDVFSSFRSGWQRAQEDS
ncbi:HAMP domain-containing protein [Microbispora cellulosiformans]|uniref:histidine kinase n=1 Tax=Microbispora cellulosiformans TaxID=2614688 RepID=A0A5J5JXL7_9ACTN|nr:nitrate- and nitrite sensing domain-containing protein [Microbispora cellulosiformans]KAA9376431.1 HAMP domain-containing protein [Microbispora cellulosiformans]